jgi:hypothetical protein
LMIFIHAGIQNTPAGPPWQGTGAQIDCPKANLEVGLKTISIPV